MHCPYVGTMDTERTRIQRLRTSLSLCVCVQVTLNSAVFFEAGEPEASPVLQCQRSAKQVGKDPFLFDIPW